MKKLVCLSLSFLFLSVVWAQPYGTGMVFDDDAYDKAPLKAPLTRNLYTNLPKHATLKPFCPVPGSQGQLSTCVGWASNWAARTILESIQLQRTNPAASSAEAFSPGYIYHVIKDRNDKDCSFGSSIFDAMNYMKFNGTVKNYDYNIQCAPQIDPRLSAKAGSYKIKDYVRLFDKEKSDQFKVQASKKALSEGNPVVFGMICPPSFYDAKGVWKPKEQPESRYGGHAMCVVGYDDEKHGGAFEILNSWGTRWGNEGYIWVTYADYGRFTKYAYEVIGEPLAKPAQQKIQDVVVAPPLPRPEVVTPEPVKPEPVKPEPVKPEPVKPEPVKPEPVVVAYPDLSGRLKLMTDRGWEMEAMFAGNQYKTRQSHRSGTSFRMYISNNEPAYVYAIGTDQTQEIFQLFPYQPEISPYLHYRQNEIALPDEDHYITMDNTVGKDYICLIYSKKELNLEAIKSEISMAKGSFLQKVRAALRNDLVSPSDITYSPAEMRFEAFSKGKSAVILMLEIDHIP
jgi:hypothetical protein